MISTGTLRGLLAIHLGLRLRGRDFAHLGADRSEVMLLADEMRSEAGRAELRRQLEDDDRRASPPAGWSDIWRRR